MSSEEAAASLLFPAGTVPDPLSRAQLMEQLIRAHLAQDPALATRIFNDRYRGGVTTEGTALERILVLAPMIRSYFLSFCVPFDSEKDDTDEENYYMEREWRVVGDVKFTLGDVCRVVLPDRFARRLRTDVPEYFGQITFPR